MPSTTSSQHFGTQGLDFQSGKKCFYMTTAQMSSHFPEHALNILSLNVRSLQSKFDRLSDFVISTKTSFPVIALQEVWSVRKQLSLPGYHPLQSQSRDQSGPINPNCGGGVGLYVAKNLDFEPLPSLNTFIKGVYESVWLLLTDKGNKGGQKFIVGSIYRPDTAPRANINLALELHENILNKIKTNKILKKCKIYIMSDFNLDLSLSNNHQPVKDYLLNQAVFGLNALVTISAHPTSTSSKVIDHVFSSILPSQCIAGVLNEHFSDHLPVVISDLSTRLAEPTPDPPTRSFSKNNIKDYLTLLKSATFIVNPDDIKGSFDSFFNIITTAADTAFPLKAKKSRKNKGSPWITRGLIKSSQQKKKLFTIKLKSPSVANRLNFSKYNRIFMRCVRQAKKLFYLNSFSAAIKDPKQTWTLINEVTGRGKSSTPLPSSFTIPLSSSTSTPPTTSTSDTQQVANGFNDFFSSIGQTLATKIDQNKFPNNNFENFLGEKPDSTFFLLPVSIGNLMNIVNELKNKNSSGADLLSNSLLKIAIPHLLIPLKKLIDLSFSTGFVPNQIKVAKVIPLHKEGDRSAFNNYRPIAVISSIGKVIEKAVHQQLYRYLEMNGLLTNSQFGFRTHHGIEHPLFLFAERVRQALNRGNHIMSLFIDLKKAFDTVNFSILLSKLSHYGIRGTALKWFENYLVRFQHVQVGDIMSELIQMLCGIPQGTVLGPLLFLIFVNDLASATTLLSLLFADDCNLQGEHPDLGQLYILMNEQLGVAEKWFNANLLTLNIKKTKFLLFLATPTPLNQLPVLKIGDKEIERVGKGQPEEAVRFLGVHIDESLDFKSHINILKGKLSSGIFALASAKEYTPLKVRKNIYYALVESYLRFGCILYSGAKYRDIRELEILQKKAIRHVAGAHPWAHTDPIFQSLGILKLSDLISLERVTFIHKYQHNKLPDAFKFGFLKLVNPNTMTRRQDPGHYFQLPNLHKLTPHSPISLMIDEWNQLPYPTRCIACHKAFKAEVTREMIASYTFFCTLPSCKACTTF